MSDPTPETRVQTTTNSELPKVEDGVAPLPRTIGRYDVKNVLGSGGFGRVYLAYDVQLRRHVAIKVPRARRRGNDEFCQAFLAEAQTLAKLDHPHIVPVYDVGSSEFYPCYIVSKYIDGENLHRRLPSLQWDWRRRTELVACIAEALHSAHLAGLVHRDVKPGNILLDQSDRAYLADFGLALSDEIYLQADHKSGVVGTLSYMSPEQVRGEGHLVDGRADIFSLGVVMYELLTGVRPFRSETREQLMREIVERDAKPLRQRKQDVPRELERICLRALERKTSMRYTTAQDFAEELRAWLDDSSLRGRTSSAESMVTLFPGPSTTSASDTDTYPPGSSTPESTSHTANTAVALVPKGMRAFDADDAEFFLQILPGPKDRHGVPESLRFWKHRIETHQPDESFRIGVLYGPSGCGKSSLIRAGLLPLLADHIQPIAISATAQGTEERLQRGLLAACPELQAPPSDKALVGTLQSLRLNGPPPSQRKLLIVIDQFEQWLSQHGEEEEPLLLHALRQCDGLHIQCLLLVRNDFWMSISRTMERLQSPILQGHNGWGVELFDTRHAQRVLFAFGHAYGALPNRVDKLSGPQQRFLEQSIEQLADNGRVICVRLAVFAQMLRDKVWEPQTLKEFGGVRGLGARFLEDTFYGDSAQPDNRRFATAAREILRNLLPKPGSDIRGAALTEQQLAHIVRLPPASSDFIRLLQLLSEDLRLLTPVDSLSSLSQPDQGAAEPKPSDRHYQLTHDYLVPSLRTWLTAKQRETISGRAQLCLEERTALWEISHESKQLPSWLETWRILTCTQRSTWSEAQSEMMRYATQLRRKQVFTRGLLAISLLVAVLLTGIHARNVSRQRTADALINQLVTAKNTELLPIVELLDQYAPLAHPKLSTTAEDSQVDVEKQFRALLALSGESNAWCEQLLGLAHRLDAHSLQLVIQRLRPSAAAHLASLWEHLETATSRSARLRYAALLVSFDPVTSASRLHAYVPDLCEALLDEVDAQESELFCEYLAEVGDLITPELAVAFHDSLRNDSQRADAAKALANFAQAELLAELLLSATASQHINLLPAVNRQSTQVAQLTRQALQERLSDSGELQSDNEVIANGLMALIRLAPSDPLISQCLSQQSDGTPRARLILQCHNYSIPLEKIWEARQNANNVYAKQALLLACEPYHAAHHRPSARVEHFARELQTLYQQGTHQAERSAAQWILKRWGMANPPLPADCFDIDMSGSRNWWQLPQGQTLVILEQPVYDTGPQSLVEPPPASDSTAPTVVGTRRFAISTEEITRHQFARFQLDYEDVAELESEHCPANRIDAVTAMQYCRWLSEQALIPADQMCYPQREQITVANLHLSDEELNRTGYRLPTEAEWELACRAESTAVWSHGSDPQLLIHFGWFAANSEGRLHPVGSLLPNSYGLFDMHGNIAEWCHPAPSAKKDFAQRGGNYKEVSINLASTKRNYPYSPAYSFTGFRIAKTVASPIPIGETE